MTEDFVALSPGKPPIIGKDVTRREVVCDLADLEIQSLQFEPAEIAVHGNWAWTWGRSQVVMRAKGDADFITVDGKYLWILRRQADGTWLIARDSAQAD
jgi:ketosteroid isomerase-like protein